MSILFITVGGSPQPIITAIQSLNPDRTVFVCSDGAKGSISQVIGEGKPCEVRRGAEGVERLPNLPTHLGMGDRFNPDTDLVRLDNPDDLAECYRRIAQKISGIKTSDPNAPLYADYTGGTKTMSLALGMAALDYGVTLYLTTNATRENLIRVDRGESTERAPTTAVTVERVLRQDLPKLLQAYNYAGAIAALRTLLQSLEMTQEQKRKLRELLDICTGFDAWDRFDHLTAWSFLSMYMSRLQSYGLALKRVLSSRQTIDPDFSAAETISGHGYELVEDLLLNAQRRAYQQRYDDAVSRLYRALELLAQSRLSQTYGLQTGDIDPEKLPVELREQYSAEQNPRNGKIQLPLWKGYVLLSELAADPLGQLFQEQSKPLENALQARNYSLFAHGFKPITENDYRHSGQVIQTFIKTALERIIPAKNRHLLAQFPTDLAQLLD